MYKVKCSDCGCEGIHACLGKPVDSDVPLIQPCTKKLEAWLKKYNGVLIGDPPLRKQDQASIIRWLDKNDKKVKNGK